MWSRLFSVSVFYDPTPPLPWSHMKKKWTTNYYCVILPECAYVTLGYMLSQIRPSMSYVVCNRLCSHADTDITKVSCLVRVRGINRIGDKARQFLPERDYVTFGSLLSQFRLSVCRLSSVTLVHPTQEVEPFGKISSPNCVRCISVYAGHPLTSVQNFTEIVPGEPLRRGR